MDDSTPEALLSAAVTADPLVAEEEDPEVCQRPQLVALEIDQLRQHVCPTVASLASLFAAPMTATTPPIEIEPLAALTYQSLGQLETQEAAWSTAGDTRPEGPPCRPHRLVAARRPERQAHRRARLVGMIVVVPQVEVHEQSRAVYVARCGGLARSPSQSQFVRVAHSH